MTTEDACCVRAYYCPTLDMIQCGLHSTGSVCCTHPELHEALIPGERIRAVLRMLLDSGDITPMGVRLVEQALNASTTV